MPFSKTLSSRKLSLSFLCAWFALTLQEMSSLQSESGGDVSVEVSAAPGEDLMGKLNEMRKEYEYIIQRNREEVERWYESKVNPRSDISVYAKQLILVDFQGTAHTVKP